MNGGEQNSENRRLVFCGDIHGELETLVWDITFRKLLENTDVIILGDFGIGFDKSFGKIYGKVKPRLESKGNILHVLRGNHDDPSWFDGAHDMEYIKFLQDYKIIQFRGLDILPIGGATSVDRELRKKKNSEYERFGSSRRVWWEGEKISRQKLPIHADIVITHQAPLMFDPVISRLSDMDDVLYSEILEERKYLDEVAEKVNPSYWYYGHHHNSYSGCQDKIMWRGLGINELFENLNI